MLASSQKNITSLRAAFRDKIVEIGLALQVCPEILDGKQVGDIGRIRRYHIDIQPLHLLQRSLRVVVRRQIWPKHRVFALMVFLDERRSFCQALRTINFPVHGQPGAKEEQL